MILTFIIETYFHDDNVIGMVLNHLPILDNENAEFR